MHAGARRLPRTGLTLFLAVRHTVALSVVIAVLGVAGRMLGGRATLVGEQQPVPVPWAVLLPAAIGFACAVSVRAHPAWLEHTAARPMTAYRNGYLVATTALATAAVAWSGSALDGSRTQVAALRNLAGCTGLALIAVSLLPRALAWLVPAALVFGSMLTGDEHGPLAVTWLIRDDVDGHAAALAAGFLAVGVCAAQTRRFERGPRE